MHPSTVLLALLIAATLSVDAVLICASSSFNPDVALTVSGFLAAQIQVAAMAFVLRVGPWLIRSLILLATLLVVSLVSAAVELYTTWPENLSTVVAFFMVGLAPLVFLRLGGVRISESAFERQPDRGMSIRGLLALTLIFSLCFAISKVGSANDIVLLTATLTCLVCAALLPLWFVLGDNYQRRHWGFAALLLLCYLGGMALFRREFADDRILGNSGWSLLFLVYAHLPTVLFAAIYAWVLRCAGWRIVWPQRTQDRPTLAGAPGTRESVPQRGYSFSGAPMTPK